MMKPDGRQRLRVAWAFLALKAGKSGIAAAFGNEPGAVHRLFSPAFVVDQSQLAQAVLLAHFSVDRENRYTN